MESTRYLLSTILVVIAFFSYSQKCKFETNEEDPFSGKQKKVSKTKGLYSASDLGSPNVDGIRDLYFSLTKEGSEYSMQVDYIMFGERNKAISQTDSMYLKLENGEMIALNPSQKAAPISAIAGTAVMTKYSIQYRLNSGDLDLLSSSILTHLKCNVGESPESVFKLIRAYTKRAQQMFNCIK